MRPGIALTAVVTAGLLLASCGRDTVGSGIVDSGTVAPASSTSPTTASSTTTSGPVPNTTTPDGAAATASVENGAYGYITAGPTCPVEKPDQPCPPRPVSDSVNARNANGAGVVSTRSDSYGRYTLDLSPGTYMLVVATPAGPAARKHP